MNKQAKRNGFLLLGLCAIALMQCSPTKLGMDGGPTTQTGNGMIAGVVYKPGGAAPAQGAIVYVRRSNTLADISGFLGENATDTVVTDDDGRFKIDSIDTGVYTLEETDGGNNFAINHSVVVKNFDSTLTLPADTLKPAGAIRGRVRLAEGGDPRKVFVLVFGLDRFAPVEAGGAFIFKKLAEGKYALRIFPTLDNYGIVDTMNIPVASGDTFDLGSIAPAFLGIPTVKQVAASYDTLFQRVTLRWNKPVAPAAASFNIYRRAVDPVTAIFTQLNMFPVLDTVFVDSLCEPDRTYEYRVGAVDADADEGKKSSGDTVHTVRYEITPKNLTLVYDTLKQTVLLHWGTPDTSLVTGYNIYRRNADRNEAFWTPYNNSPITDTTFIDSTFPLCPKCGFASSDTGEASAPVYEYCVGAIIRDIREGTRSEGRAVRISLTGVTPAGIQFAYDSLKQSARLFWSKLDTSLIAGFNIYRKSHDAPMELSARLNRALIKDTLYVDSTGLQNQTYDYRVTALVKNNRAEIKSDEVTVRFIDAVVGDSVKMIVQ